MAHIRFALRSSNRIADLAWSRAVAYGFPGLYTSEPAPWIWIAGSEADGAQAFVTATITIDAGSIDNAGMIMKM